MLTLYFNIMICTFTLSLSHTHKHTYKSTLSLSHTHIHTKALSLSHRHNPSLSLNPPSLLMVDLQLSDTLLAIANPLSFLANIKTIFCDSSETRDLNVVLR
jgi:hypothetical protein